MNTPQKISMFWLVLLGGLFGHAILGLMPLVYASGAAKAAANLPLAVLWQLSVVFSLPLALAALTATTAARWARLVNLSVAGLFLFINLAHIVSHLIQPPVEWHQVFLLTTLSAAGAVQTATAVEWLKEKT